MATNKDWIHWCLCAVPITYFIVGSIIMMICGISSYPDIFFAGLVLTTSIALIIYMVILSIK